MTPHTNDEPTRLDRARNLFEFLRQAQLLKCTPVHTISSYDYVLWLSDLPDHEAITSAHRAAAAPEQDDPLLTVDRVAHEDPPETSGQLRPWLLGDPNDAGSPPTLRDDVPAHYAPDLTPRETDQGREAVVRFEDHLEIRQQYDTWLARWKAWAEVERKRRPVRDLYGELFQTYVTATNHMEEFELVLGVGCLSWIPAEHEVVKRHVFTTPVVLHLDDDSGRITVAAETDVSPLRLELDMLDPGLLQNHQHITALRNKLLELAAHPLDRDEVAALTRRLVNSLDANGTYTDEDEPATPGRTAAGTFAPALILRKRSQRGMVEIFETIVAQLAEVDEVPSGILPLVDPDHQVSHKPDETPGAIVDVDDEPFLPLPVNDQQLKILRSVDTRAQTVVQGPPGTGKTHTAAALLSHLLAQGKRVLVTAYTDQALHEVRGKLPEEIQPLAVSVVGTSRSDLADLKVAVDRIAGRSAEHDPGIARTKIESTLSSIDALGRDRATTYQQLLDAREHEVTATNTPATPARSPRLPSSTRLIPNSMGGSPGMPTCPPRAHPR